MVFFPEDGNYLSKRLSHLKRLLFIRIKKWLVFIMCTHIYTYLPAGACLNRAFHQAGFNGTEFFPKFLFTQCLSSLATNKKRMQKDSTTALAGIFLWNSSQNLSVINLLVICKVLDKLFHIFVIFPYIFLQKMKTVLHCKTLTLIT